MQFIDLAAQQRRLRQTIEANLRAVLDHGQYIMGPEVAALERRLAEFVGVRHAIGCASGTDALLMALMALGIGPGDAVFTTPFTFFATAEVIRLLGAVPVFVDIDPATQNLSAGALEEAVLALETADARRHPLPRQALSLEPRAVLTVDLFGVLADYDGVGRVAKQHGLAVVQDAAQSFGAELRGERSCRQGLVGCTSFFPAKPLGAYGDAGMCFTDDEALAADLDSIRQHGKGSHRYEHIRLGLNGRLDTLQAAVLLAKIEIFPEELELRQAAADRYQELLAPAGDAFVLPAVPADRRSAWAQYSLLAASEEARSAALAALTAATIPYAIHYPLPVHRQAALANLGYRPGDFPVAEDHARRIFSLPMHPYLRKEDQEQVAAALLGLAARE
ncbi:MAG: DegT/DnrJ/EryC1/StrS family aminotransferase [Thermodesulfobacteriota bacterium]